MFLYELIYHIDRVDMLSLTTQNYKHNMTKIRKYKSRYLLRRSFNLHWRKTKWGRGCHWEHQLIS